MAKIEKLTDEQVIQLREYHDTWLRYGCSTDRADRAKAEAAITGLYREIGQSNTPEFVWCQSPAAALSVIDALKSGKAKAVHVEVVAETAHTVASLILAPNSKDLLLEAWWGQYDSFWIAYFLFCRDVLGELYSPERSRQLNYWRDIAQSCGWWWAYENTVVVCERPTVCKMERSLGEDSVYRLHCNTGPALAFADGFAVYAVHGVRVPADVIEAIQDYTPERIDSIKNVEVRRIAIERYGLAKYIRDAGCELVNESTWGRLWRKTQPSGEPILAVELENAYQEADGSRKTYFLSVQPELRPMLAGGRFGAPQALTAHNAVASTFGMRGDEYDPEIET